MRLAKYILAALLILCSNPFLHAQIIHLTIKVKVPENTPKDDSVIVVGNERVWGNWVYKTARKMQKQNDSVWMQSNEFPANTTVNFIVTRGSYYKAALYNHSGQIPPSHTFALTHDTTITLTITGWNDLYQHNITGTVRYYHNFNSPLLKYTRDITVWLPPSYFTSPEKRYPVLYAEDGQNIFGTGSKWQMDKTADSLMRHYKTEEFIIAGVANTQDRWVEYSGTPEGFAYTDFVANELKPFIDGHFRTKPDRDNTAAIGSSMGGVISFYLLWRYPNVFSKAACLSNGFYFDDGNIVAQADSSTQKLNDDKIYLDCGGMGLDTSFLPDNEKMRDILSKNKTIRLKYMYFPNDDHNEKFWAQRLYHPLIFLFGKP